MSGSPGPAWHRGGVDAFGLLVTVLVMAGVAVAILHFEKRRADGIRRDTRRLAEGQDSGEREDDDT